MKLEPYENFIFNGENSGAIKIDNPSLFAGAFCAWCKLTLGLDGQYTHSIVEENWPQFHLMYLVYKAKTIPFWMKDYKKYAKT